MNGKDHKKLGMLAGVGMGIALTIEANRVPAAAEAVGWLVGSEVGLKLPDQIEPAIHSYHRKFAHSGMVLGASLVFLQSQTLKDIIGSLHARAAEARRMAELNPQNGFWQQLLALLYEFIAGLIPAFSAGYASHLVGDLSTPRGIPLCW